MASIHFTTDVLPPASRLEAWASSLEDAFGRIEVLKTQPDPALRACYRSTERGAMRFNAMVYGGAGLTRTARSVATDATERYTLTIPNAGRLVVQHDGVERVLEPGHLYLFNHSVPYATRPQDTYGTTSIGLSAEVLRRRVPGLGPFYSLSLTGESASAGHLLRAFSGHVAEAATRWSEHEFLSLSEQMLDLVALLMVQRSAPASSETSARLAHRARALQYIRTNAAEDELNPAAVAQACGISLSYLHQLFRDSDRSVEATITEERLQLARRKLLDPVCAHMSVASVGYESGFNDATHFSRAFKRRFGATPGEVRRA
jgi:AraC-like DNA-binding protein